MAMQIFGETHEQVLRGFMEPPNGIPFHDTFGDVFHALDSSELANCFEEVGKEAVNRSGICTVGVNR